eukprot:TRINITY_DN1723_c0_g1_i2.p1 TRINITY_DN1723_c0_g1~~TRINITY_DN1723_c0_g1_i2.p1  ORF type:complete len:330 (-),score=71.47 TRINITY_DN1723_c0_g1_i2:913-1860(-)
MKFIQDISIDSLPEGIREGVLKAGDLALEKPWVSACAVVALPIVVVVGKKLVSKIPVFKYGHVDNLKDTVNRFENEVAKDEEHDPRRNFYARTVQTYYNLVTDFYEWGWGRSFHFAPRYKDETFEASITRYEHKVAACLNLAGRTFDRIPHVLDVGCGIGGPMRAIARFFGYKVHITGINITPEHIARGKRHNERLGARNCDFLQADFNQLPVPDNSIDGAYDFEALCHSADLARTFREIFRVLKPGGRFVTAHYCCTDKWDPNNPEHVAIMRQFDNLIGTFSFGRTQDVVRRTFEQAGFRVLSSENVFAPENGK